MKKKILLIATGGTIASANSEEGLKPLFSSQQLIDSLPEISDICDVDNFQLFSLDSTNISRDHWLAISQCIQERYDQYDGFVITHGTDTMAYTAAALSYLIQDSPKPIVLTGSQRPINLSVTDAKMNLMDSFRYCCADGSCGVQIVFSGNVILGTRARKINTKSFQAFASINYPYLAVIQDDHIIQYIDQPRGRQPRFYQQMSDRVALIKLIPGITGEYLKYFLQRNDALVVESYGVGGLPMLEKYGFQDAIDYAVANGRTLVMSTQVQNEGSDMTIYQVGHHLKSQKSIIEAYDMTTEAVVTKLMWILAQTTEFRKIRKMFYQPVAQDILFRD
ncbi:MAG: asparaginase [Erysipelotrichaceae bacterium]|nr:asparaginase [Erysipelotrichaceae bacterium]MBO4537856.1 asparaginase [Erysipelotrichaceae bacterium]